MQYSIIKLMNRPMIVDMKEAWIIKRFIETKQLPHIADFDDKKPCRSVVYGSILHNEDCQPADHARLKEYLFAYPVGEEFRQLSIVDFHISVTMMSGGLTFTPFAALIETEGPLPDLISECITAFLRFEDMDIITNLLNREYIYALKEDATPPSGTIPPNWKKLIDETRMIEVGIEVR